MRTPYPLQWPDGWKRTPADQRKPSRFFYGFADSLASLLDELKRIGATNITITSDLPTRPNGLPYAEGRKMVSDPGIAVWFVLHDQERVFACDRWQNHAENLRAIALSIEAIRGLDRWGAGDLITRAFQGFNALPPGDAPPAPRDWRSVLDMVAVVSERDGETRRVELWALVRERHRTQIKTAHPDAGGDPARAAQINAQRDQRQAELDRALEDARTELGRGMD